jgi:hypothetical protein
VESFLLIFPQAALDHEMENKKGLRVLFTLKDGEISQNGGGMRSRTDQKW